VQPQGEPTRPSDSRPHDDGETGGGFPAFNEEAAFVTAGLSDAECPSLAEALRSIVLQHRDPRHAVAPGQSTAVGRRDAVIASPTLRSGRSRYVYA
jgi:hypothetical protein